MNTEFDDFLRQLAGVIVMSLLPVALAAFITVPMNLGQHPGDVMAHGRTTPVHMT